MKATVILLSVLFIFSIASCDQFKKQPEKLSKEKKIELSEKCSRSGKTYFDEFWRSTNVLAIQFKTKYSWDDPEYYYSEKLNTCLIHIRYMEFDYYQSSISHHYNQIIDVLTNKTLVRGWFEV
ncbi:MAG: hypothetical protein NTX36_10800 [Proteobacteria bacterium]|nr:hypothetical protein [Pseudomonadota bacterium]